MSISQTDGAGEVWHESESFWRAMGGVIFQDEMWERAPTEVDELLELTGMGPRSRILDMACGPGRHSLEFAERGHEVTGVDRTERYLEEAESRAEARGLEVEWVRADMREFRRPEAYDLAASLYTSFGLFEQEADNLAVLSNLRDSIAPGGSIAVEVVGKAFIAANFNRRTWQEFDDGTLFLARREVDGPWRWLHNHWTLVAPDGSRRSFEMRHRLYSAVELEAMLERAGFRDVEIYGGFDGRRYDRDSRRLLAVAERPRSD